jgi:putative endonuclease
MLWYVYVLECKDGSLYTGITLDLDRRVREHNSDNRKGAKYTRTRRPVILKYTETYKTQSEARVREAAIKSWKREYKIKLINSKPK